MFSGDNGKEHWSRFRIASFFSAKICSLSSFSGDTIYEVVPFGTSGAIKFKLLSFEAFVNSKRSFKYSFFYFMCFRV